MPRSPGPAPMSGASLWLTRGALAMSVAYVGLLLVLFALRIGYPHTLEWEEGAMLDQSLRILRGGSLYVEPSIEFVSQLYAPLYFYLGAGLVGLSVESFAPLRALSILATLGSGVLTFVMARRETGDWVAPVLAVGFLAGTYRLSSAWFDIARVDMLFLFFVVAGIFLVRSMRTVGMACAAGVLFWLAFVTKQQAVAFALAMAIHLVWAGRARLALPMVATFGALAAASTWALDVSTNGWSTYYVFEMPGGHEFFWPMALGFWTMDLLIPMAPACAVCVAWLVDGLRGLRTGGDTARADFSFWLMVLGTSVATSWLSRMHWGGAQNVVIPAYWAIAWVWGIGLSRWLKGPEPRATLIGVVAVIQLGWLFYDPRPLVPSEADVAAGDALIERLREIDGEVWTSWHGFVPERAGKRVYAHRSGLHDVMRAGESPARRALERSFREALETRRFSAVVVDQPYFLRDYMRGPLLEHYESAGRMLAEGQEVGGLLGYRANPFLYLPKDAPSDEGAEVLRR